MCSIQPGTEWINSASGTKRAACGIILILAAALWAAGCGGGKVDWFAKGKQFAIKEEKAQGSPRVLTAAVLTAWCERNVPSGAAGTAASDWVKGCEAGYYAVRPEDSPLP
jgi:hypothetical protein